MKPMKPRKQDVEQMVAALMAVLTSTARAGRKGEPSRLMALYAIGASPGSSPTSISETLGLHPSSVTRQIQALEEDGYVKVAADPRDGRSCAVTLTSAGRAEIGRLQAIGLRRFASFVARWEAAEVRAFTRLLVKFEQSKAEVSAAEAEAKPSGARWRQAKRQ